VEKEGVRGRWDCKLVKSAWSLWRPSPKEEVAVQGRMRKPANEHHIERVMANNIVDVGEGDWRLSEYM
jgi:hypothetical protein